MKVKSLVSSLVVLFVLFFAVGDAFAYSSSSRSSSRSSYSSHRSSSSSYHRSSPSRSSSYHRSSSYKPRTSTSTRTRTRPSSGINTKKSPTTKSYINTKKPTTTSKSVSLKKPSYARKSTVVNIHINKRPRTSRSYYHGHHTYVYGGRSVYFMGGDFNDCDYEDYMTGDSDCQAYYPDDNNYAAAASAPVQTKYVNNRPNYAWIVLKWILTVLFFGILITALLMIAKRRRR